VSQLRSHYPLIAAAGAGICWAAALALLFYGDLGRLRDPLAPERLLYYTLVLAAALLTFAPIELHLSLTGLTAEGVVGSGLLAYTLAFVPAPQGWLLEPADLPVYGLFFIALLITGAATARPFIAVLSRRFYQQRARAYDQRRVRRQAYEVGLVLATAAALASLNVLNWVSLLLILAAIVIAELLILSRVQVEH
jgi:hypothetical protein